MIYGYCRISTPKQSIERQIRNIKNSYPDAILYQEKFTGTTLDRPEWRKLKRKLCSGDMVIFDSVSRMSRDAQEGVALYRELYNTGIELAFLKEPHIDTAIFREAAKKSVPMTGTDVDYILAGVNRYLLALADRQIEIAFEQAEKEVSDLRQRTIEGLETARRNGTQLGRPAGRTYVTEKQKRASEQILRLSKSFGGHNTDAEVMAITGISRNSYYKYKQMLKLERSENNSDADVAPE